MNKKSAMAKLLLTLIAVVLLTCACTGGPDTPPVTAIVEVTANQSNVSLKNDSVESFDYTTLFSVTSDGESVTVTKEMLDLSALSPDVDSFEVTCSYGDKSAAVKVTVTRDVWTVDLSQNTLTISVKEVKYYNFRALFTVKKNGINVGVANNMVDSDVSETPGTYHFTVTAGSVSQTLTVTVREIEYKVELAQEEVTVRISAVEDYDFNALFTVTEEGVAKQITDDMVETNIVALVGTYHYTVKFGTASKTLTVHVSDAYEINIIPSYKTLSLTPNQLQNYDWTMLFSVYVDGEAAPVTESMIDVSQLSNATVGQTYTVTITYQKGATTKTCATEISVVENAAIKVDTKNVVTYPNSEYIDLTTLFTITQGNKTIPVTNEMISGTIDYSIQDEAQIITLTYLGVTYQSTVTVRRGVIIDYASSDVITIKSGTDINSYLFAEDFVVLVNGVRFRNLMQFVNLTGISRNGETLSEAVDFSTVGSYKAILEIPYNNEKASGLSGPKMQIFEKEITYNVVSLDYSLSVEQDVVSLPKGTESFDVFSNLKLVRNGYNTKVMDNIEWINIISCYGQLVSEPLDFSATGLQLVEIDVYVFCTKAGTDLGEPVRISFYVEIVGDVKVVATDKTVFGNTTIYTTDLFTITEGEENILVTADMVSGKVDTFRAGTYYITAEYKNVTATAKVVVINPQLAGVYKTGQTPIPVEEPDYSDEGGEDYWGDDPGWGEYSLATYSLPSNTLGNMVITTDGTITVNGVSAQFIGAIDENTLIVQIGSNDYTLYYQNGIVALDPDNSAKLGFSEYKRPLVYFHADMWEIDQVVTINYGSQHVLTTTTTCYSYDVFHIVSDDGEKEMWYGLRVELIGKTSADTIYSVEWGEVQFGENFQVVEGNASTLTFNGITVKFVMQDATTGKVDRTEEEKVWANQIFDGVVDGKKAQLVFNQLEALDYYIDGQKIVSVGTYEFGNMKNGGIDHAGNTVMVYFYDGEKPVSTYKFLINPQDNTFEYVQPDGIFGKYVSENMMVFLDGYGTGIVNFDTRSYYTYQFQYTLINNELKITFFNTNALFGYGKYITFNMADLKNVLTVKHTENAELQGKVFTNCTITDGAIVSFNQSVFTAGSASYKEDIYKSISIVTKDGELTTEQKKSTIVTPNGEIPVVDLSSVSNRKDGFYQIAVTVSVDNVPKTTYFAIQMVRTAVDNETLFGAANLQGIHTLYGTLQSQNVLTLDRYGNATAVIDGVTYSGYCVLNTNNSKFTVKAFAQSGASVTLSGTLLQNGVFEVRCGGALTFIDYFAKGTRQLAGCAENVLREINVDGVSTYIWAFSETAVGEIVSVEIDEKDKTLFTITKQSGESFVAKVTWSGDSKKGIVLADSLRGTYTKQGDKTLVVDGFGNITVGATLGTYIASGNYVTVTVSNTVYAYKLDKTNGTYEILTINVGAVIYGKTYSLTYVFTLDDVAYFATTKIYFGSGGKVTISSECSDYEEEFGAYLPSFVGEGTYTIVENKIKMEIKGKTFAFSVSDVIQCKNIKCDSTTLSDGDIGYFAVGATFTEE